MAIDGSTVSVPSGDALAGAVVIAAGEPEAVPSGLNSADPDISGRHGWIGRAS
jgi:hypothetical protein